MSLRWQSIIEQTHASGRQAVLAITGGGSGAIAELLCVPGASRTVLEAIVPYDLGSLAEFLGRTPDHACSAETAAAMARQALARAGRLAPDCTLRVGVGVTASLASDRPKHGDHRCHIAVIDDAGVEVISIVLEKGRRDRAVEEQLVTDGVVLALARACGVSVPDVRTILGPLDQLTVSRVSAGDLLDRLLQGSISRLTVLPDGRFDSSAPLPLAVLAGSFNPLHAGHGELARQASRILSTPVVFEMSVVNVDKPPLGADEVRRRLDQFAWRNVVELTRAATFLEKSRLLPGATFVVGVDTAERIVDADYYGGAASAVDAALREMGDHACRFLVAGRIDSTGRFRTLADVAIPAAFVGLFAEIPESDFRVDLSSTEVRARVDG